MNMYLLIKNECLDEFANFVGYFYSVSKLILHSNLDQLSETQKKEYLYFVQE